MKVLAIANQKGGVGKTTTSLNLAYCLSKTMGYKVLLIDSDSQGSAGLNLGIDVFGDDDNAVMLDDILEPMALHQYVEPNWEQIEKSIVTPTFENRMRDPQDSMKWITYNEPFGFDIIPSRLYLSVVEMYIGMTGGRNGSGINTYMLRDVINLIEIHRNYDYIIIDCPPSLGPLSLNDLAAAKDGIIAVSNLDVMSLRGMSSFIQTVDTVKEKVAGHRGILGILLTLHSDRRTVDKNVENWVQQFLPIPTFDTRIPDTTNVKKANSMMMLYAQIDKKGKAAYDSLAKEVDFAVNHPDVLIGSAKMEGGNF